MREVVSLFLPTWPTDRQRRRLGPHAPPPDRPFVLTGMEGPRRVITAADNAARAIGIHAGMPATKAQALVPELLMQDADVHGDRDALDRLALWALRRYAPMVAADYPDGLMIDITGTSHILGGTGNLLRDLVRRLSEIGTAARAVSAPTYGAAHALARYGKQTIAVVTELEGSELRQLPVAALRLDARLVAGLSKVGVETIGELEAMPRASLALRFTSEPGRRLDQAFGRASEPIEPVELPELPIETQRFAEPIGAAETMARYTAKLVDRLCDRLERDGVGVRRLDLRFHRVDNAVEAIRAGTAKPTRDRKQLTRLLCDRIETIAPGFGIETMTLAAPLVEPLNPSTISNLGEKPAPDVAALVDILGNRIGEHRIYRIAARESDIPERSVTKIAPMADPTLLRWRPDWPRPMRLLHRPEPIDTMALLPDHPPVHFVWRGIRRRVKRADGPERIYGEWHLSDAEMLAVRDYFLVEDETGARYWVFRAGDGMDAATGGQGWFMHGLFG